MYSYYLIEKVEVLSKKEEEAANLKDQLDELNEVGLKLQKAEKDVERYKQKLEESNEFRKRIKVVFFF